MRLKNVRSKKRALGCELGLCRGTISDFSGASATIVSFNKCYFQYKVILRMECLGKGDEFYSRGVNPQPNNDLVT